MDTKEIEQIVGKYLAFYWISLDPTVYYRNGEPYGLLATVIADDGTHMIASTTADPALPFTKNMIRAIICLYKTESMCLISSHPQSWKRLQKVLDRYGFMYEYAGDTMFAYHMKEDHVKRI